MIFQTIPEYDHLSFAGQYKCAVCGSGRRKDEVIFRPPMPDDFDGFFDICSNCVREAADFLGIRETATIEAALDQSEEARVAAVLQAQEAREAMATVVRENVRLQDELEDLNAPQEISYEALQEFARLGNPHE